MRWPIWRVAVAERSMEPALRPGDWLLVWRGLRAGSAPSRSGREADQVSGRRRSGRLVSVKPGQLVIARHPDRPDLLLVKRAARRDPAGWSLISDNTGVGEVDSRAFGLVPPELIEGRVLARYWPLGRRPRAGIRGRPGGGRSR